MALHRRTRPPVASLAIWLVLATGGFTGLSRPAGGAERVQFNRDIRPILSDTCFLCHGPDKNSRAAELRLDIREEALKPAESGGIPIVPGKPEESELVRRVFAADAGERMPPEELHKDLTPRQKDLLRRWVAEGAEYQPHWLYVPLVRPEVPAVTDSAGPVTDPIDAFILQVLAAKSLDWSAEADRRTLLRRLSLDLTGLPPSPEEVEAFVRDTSPDAYERQVDRLLQSPHFGERMAVWWLDVARFTDTVGFHGDQNQRIFPYRDYVIDAFNQNKPFDQFTVEQLAGDLLPDPTPEQRVATGFNRLNMMTREGGAQPKEYLAKYGADRVRTIGTAWLGSTLGCTECHDHKFDPFTARDFYSLQAFFADIKQWGVYADYGYTPNPELKGWSNDHPFPPEVEVESSFLKRRQVRLAEQIAALEAASADRLRGSAEDDARFLPWQEAAEQATQQNPQGWQTPQLTATLQSKAPAETKKKGRRKAQADQPASEASPGSEEKVQIEPDGLVRFAGDGDGIGAVQFTCSPTTPWIASVRLDLLPEELPPEKRGAGAVPRQMLRLTAAIVSAKGKDRPVNFYFADANHREPRYSNTEELLGIADGWLMSDRAPEQPQSSIWLLDPPVKLAEGESLRLTVQADQRLLPLRIALSPLAIDPSTSFASTESEPGPAVTREAYLRSTGWDAAAFARYRQLYREKMACRGGKAWTMVTMAVEPYPIRILPRGNWLDESGPVVEPAVPHFLPPVASNGNRLTRLDLARWLCSTDNPVTPRNIVNRLWKQFFGNALSNVVDDLGAQGEPPSHPELLDWLAVEFRDGGWNVKQLIKRIVMSRTYRQDSRLRPEVLEMDPNNRWLSSQNPRRLDAEFIRDTALAVSGLLNRELGGPSVKPYQPPDYYANLQFPNRVYQADTDEQQWRRGVYVHWQRTFLHPMLANFDAPGREECTANRVVSNTPQQALTLLNDPTFVEAARVLAQRLLDGEAAGDAERVERAYAWVLNRPAKPAERESLLRFLAGQREHFQGNRESAERLIKVGLAPPHPGNPVELAAWTSVARVLLNLQETITRY